MYHGEIPLFCLAEDCLCGLFRVQFLNIFFIQCYVVNYADHLVLKRAIYITNQYFHYQIMLNFQRNHTLVLISKSCHLDKIHTIYTSTDMASV